MKRWERWTFHALTLIVALSGLMYFLMKYFVRTDDPFAVVNHPWQGAMLAVHVLTSPVLLLSFGMLLSSHVLRKLTLTTSPNRRSGFISLGSFGVMAVSGYLLQTATSPLLLRALVVLHVATAIVFVMAYVGHLVVSIGELRARAATPVRSRA